MAEENIMGLFKVMILIQLFYSVCITLLAYGIPSDAINYVTSFSDITERVDLESVTSNVQTSLESQTNIGVIELGALVFYSGNILIDLLLNFAFALPQMFGLIVHGISTLFNFDSFIYVYIQLFASSAILVLYFISLIQLLTGIRSGRVV